MLKIEKKNKSNTMVDYSSQQPQQLNFKRNIMLKMDNYKEVNKLKTVLD